MEDHAQALSLPNNQNPRPFAPIFHTSMQLPHASNHAAKVNPQAEVMYMSYGMVKDK